VDGRPQALPIVEAVPEQDAFYDFESRYEIGRTRFICPAELEPDAAARIQELALQAFQLLGCSVFARVDLMLDTETAEPFVLEVNPIPGLTGTSLLPQAADAAGIGFDDLIARIVARAS
jgi:D-alanine-D-alanine ligase